MNVRILIAYLESYDPNSIVKIVDSEWGSVNVQKVEENDGEVILS